MTPLQKARRILALHEQIGAYTKRLAQLEETRNCASSLDITLAGPNSSGYKVTLFSIKEDFRRGHLNDLPAVILGRYSEESAHKLRMLKTELAELEASF